mmetsp:Transcript_46993/g.134431  ORF Transcript_46993/g.134431 Transcript_46993/m.134431 type:complete len:326 (-) Transcript_46993:8-985(-)
MTDGDLPPEVDVGKEPLHLNCSLERFPAGEVQQVDILEVGLVRQVGGDEDGKPLGVLRSRRRISMEAGQLALLLHLLGVGPQDVSNLAVQREADVRAFLGHSRQLPHDELEVAHVILVLAHEEGLLVRGGAVQTVAAIEHEDLEGRDVELLLRHPHLLDVARLDRGDVIAVVRPVVALGSPHDLRQELRPRAAHFQVVLPSADVGQHRRHATHRRGFGLLLGVLLELVVDADMHVGIADAREAKQARSIDAILRSAGVDALCHLDILATSDAQVQLPNRHVVVRPHDPHILDHEVQVGGLCPLRIRLDHAAGISTSAWKGGAAGV